MYNYNVKLPEGYEVEYVIQGGSSAKVFILVNKDKRRIVRKISDEEGINKNGRDKLRKEIIFIEFFNNKKFKFKYPNVYNYASEPSCVYYDMSFIKGETLQNLINTHKQAEVIDCCNKVLNDLCLYSDIKKSTNENCALYEFYIDKTKMVIDKLLNNKEIHTLINEKELIINDIVYKNAKIIIDQLYKKQIKNRLKRNESSFCFHGDLITTNIIYYNGNVNYVDPRGEFNEFDICYDIAKMKFSFSGYDQVNRVS